MLRYQKTPRNTLQAIDTPKFYKAKSMQGSKEPSLDKLK